MPASKRTPAIEDALIEWVSAGKTVRSFCRLEGMPKWRTVYDWIAADPQLSARVARAKDLGFDALAQECLDIADDGRNDTYVDEEGRTKVDQDVIARSRLRVDTRLKLLACWDPRRYGSKMQVGGAADLPPVQLTDVERAERIKMILEAARARVAQQETDHGKQERDEGDGRSRPRAPRRPRKSS